ncbi:MAG: GlsB/YeaQ/YmgE family stress response membrane protein [bacterium]|nr:GlsB/YeaQ/YmgE family stress response membrane protein [bacterium]
MTITGLITWIVIGGIAGWLASIVMKTRRKQGLVTDIIVGIIGAFIGGFVFNTLGIGGAVAGGTMSFSIGSLIVAFVGAVILLALLRFIK